METIISPVETKFNISSAFKNNIKITDKAKKEDVNKNFKNKLTVNVSAKNKGAKKDNNWKRLAWVKLSG